MSHLIYATLYPSLTEVFYNSSYTEAFFVLTLKSIARCDNNKHLKPQCLEVEGRAQVLAHPGLTSYNKDLLFVF